MSGLSLVTLGMLEEKGEGDAPVMISCKAPEMQGLEELAPSTDALADVPGAVTAPMPVVAASLNPETGVSVPAPPDAGVKPENEASIELRPEIK